MVVLHELLSSDRVVIHRQDLLLAEAHAAHEVLPLDEFLHDHRQHAGLVIVVDQLLERAADVDISPAAAVRVLENAGQPDVLDDSLPVERKLQVPQALVVLDARDVLLVRQDDRFRARDAELRDERRAENLSSAVHMNGLLTTVVPASTACLRYERYIGTSCEMR